MEIWFNANVILIIICLAFSGYCVAKTTRGRKLPERIELSVTWLIIFTSAMWLAWIAAENYFNFMVGM